MKILLVDAICGIGVLSLQVGLEGQKSGLTSFTGNQWEPDYAWNRDALMQLPEETLQDLYEGLRAERDGIPESTDPEPSLILSAS